MPLKQLPSLNNVAAGATATLNIPVGPTYEDITLQFSGVTLAQMDNITLEINGKPIQYFGDATVIVALNDYYGRYDGSGAGFLMIPFRREEFEGVLTPDMTALGTQDVDTFTLKFDIDALAAAPVITAHANVSAPKPMGLITKIKKFPYSFSGSGQVEISDLPKGPRVAAYHFFKADVDDVELELNSIKIMDGSKSLLEETQKRSARVPQTALATHLDFLLKGDPAKALVTRGINDIRQRLTLGTSGNVDVYIEYLDGYQGI